MKIVHIASEFAPIAKAGGLGDVVAGLSKEQRRLGHDVEVIIPKYDTITEVPEGVTLIDLPDDFSRGQIYGEPDDIDRFTRFCEAAADHLDNPDIVHLHDWPTALIAKIVPFKTVLTIHNAAYQGNGLLQTGIENANALTTVSPTYAREILTPAFGCGLEDLLKKHKPIGILNGIDTDYWNPATDPLLPHRYTAPEGKRLCKEALCTELNLPKDPPLFAAICRLVDQKGPDLLFSGFEHILNRGGTAVLLGSSPDPALEEKFQALAHPNMHLHFDFNESFAHRLYAGADYALIPSLFEPCGLTQLIAMRYGTVPIAHGVGGLADTVIEGETGFTFDKPEPALFNDALDRAIREKDHLAQHGMALDVSWKKSAQEYLRVYSQLP